MVHWLRQDCGYESQAIPNTEIQEGKKNIYRI